MRRYRQILGLLGVLLPLLLWGGDSDSLPCDRELRKTIEALQAFRRQNAGRYPDSLSELTRHGYLQLRDAICPMNRRGDGSDEERTDYISSRRLGGDRSGLYEYEMSDQVILNDNSRMYLPDNPPLFTRAHVKGELLRRAFSEQVPLLRCNHHRPQPPVDWPLKDSRRNATTAGTVYWSGLFWEQIWVADVPATSRDLNIFYGLKGPPFYVDRAPSLDGTMDFRSWSSGFGDVAWWWELPYFEQGADKQRTPNLGPFFKDQHGVVRELAGTSWWINGLVQIQSPFVQTSGSNRHRQPSSQDHPTARFKLGVHRHFHSVRWLQGTLWDDSFGKPVGFLVWHYENGISESTPIRYGIDVARFWCDDFQRGNEQLVLDFVAPVWSERQSREQVGVERELRLYQQSWTNPHPELEVTTLDFIAATNASAAPFLVSMKVTP